MKNVTFFENFCKFHNGSYFLGKYWFLAIGSKKPALYDSEIRFSIKSCYNGPGLPLVGITPEWSVGQNRPDRLC